MPKVHMPCSSTDVMHRVGTSPRKANINMGLNTKGAGQDKFDEYIITENRKNVSYPLVDNENHYYEVYPAHMANDDAHLLHQQ